MDSAGKEGARGKREGQEQEGKKGPPCSSGAARTCPPRLHDCRCTLGPAYSHVPGTECLGQEEKESSVSYEEGELQSCRIQRTRYGEGPFDRRG